MTKAAILREMLNIDVLSILKKDETNASCMPYTADFPAFNELIGVQEMRNLEKTFVTGD